MPKNIGWAISIKNNKNRFFFEVQWFIIKFKFTAFVTASTQWRYINVHSTPTTIGTVE